MRGMIKSKWLLIAGVPALTGCPFDGGTCGKTSLEPWDGGLSDGGSITGGKLDDATCLSVCNTYPSHPDDCLIADGGLVQCSLQCVGGRAPPGLLALSSVDSTAGSWLSRMAELEAAAVHAFRHLAVELEAHGLSSWAHAARVAAEHEVRHAHQLTRLALRSGYAPKPLLVEASPIRSLEELAIDNAAEGCGRELFGAHVNRHQARHAMDKAVAETMAGIADDEASHARFSVELAQVLLPRLTIAQRRRAREAQERVLAALTADEVPAAARATLGLVDQSQAFELASQLLEANRV